MNVKYTNENGSIIYHLKGNILTQIVYKIIITIELYWDLGREESQGRHNIINKWMERIYGNKKTKRRKSKRKIQKR